MIKDITKTSKTPRKQAKINSDQKVVLDFMKENFITSNILEDRMK